MALHCKEEYCYDADIVSIALVLGLCAVIAILWVFWLIQKSHFFRKIGYDTQTISTASDTESELSPVAP